MATTTNYSWTTPDDTDLVKDGAAAIRTLGSSADTTVKALNPGTTAGDIDYYTAATTKARIAIGTAGQVLQVNSGATAPEWATPTAGGFTLLSTTNISGVTTTVSSISQSFKHLYIEFANLTWSTGTGFPVWATNLSSVMTRKRFDESSFATTSGITNFSWTNAANGWDNTSTNNFNTLIIENYASTTTGKTFRHFGVYKETAGSTARLVMAHGAFQSNTAIDSISVSEENGYSLTAGTIKIYGVN